MHKYNNIVAMWWMLAACILASLMVTLVRYLSDDMNVFAMVFWRNVFGVLFFLPWLLYKRVPLWQSTRFKLHSMRASTGLLGMWLWFYALTIVELPVAVALSFTAPLLISLLAAIFLKEHYSIERWLSLICGFIGVLIVLRPGTGMFDMNTLWVLLAVQLWAVSSFLVRNLSNTETPLQITFYMVFLSLPLSFIAALFFWQAPDTLELWLGVIALGFLANFFQYSLSTAISIGEFRVLMPIDFTRLIFTAILAYFVFGQKLDAYTLVGAVIIMAVAIFGAYRDAKRHRKEVIREKQEVLSGRFNE